VPVLIGSNRDEARIFFAEPKISTEADYRASMVGLWGDGANEVIGHYPWQPAPADNGYTGNYLVSATLTDSSFACGNRPTVAALAAHTSTFVYEFAHRDGPGLGDRYPGFVWAPGTPPNCRICGRASTTEFRLRRRSTRPSGDGPGAWCRTGARSSPKGRPSVPGLPRWTSFNDRPLLMPLNTGKGLGLITEQRFAQTHQCGFLDAFNQ